MSRKINMPQERYVAALRRQRERIAKGLPLRAVDDNTPGDKSTTCTWGLCSEEREAWPDAQDHLWPDQFIERGRVAPLYLKPKQKCPLDLRDLKDADLNGCFFTCRVFQAAKGARPSREEVIHLYDNRIKEVS